MSKHSALNTFGRSGNPAFTKNFNNVNINFSSSNSNKDWNIVFDSEKIKIIPSLIKDS